MQLNHLKGNDSIDFLNKSSKKTETQYHLIAQNVW